MPSSILGASPQPPQTRDSEWQLQYVHMLFIIQTSSLIVASLNFKLEQSVALSASNPVRSLSQVSYS